MEKPDSGAPDIPGRRSPHDPGGTALDESGVRWASLVDRIRSGDEASVEELYTTFARGIRYYLCRHLGAQELDDKVHDAFLIVLQAIRNGSLREPERLMGFVRTVVRRQVAAFIDQAVQNRRDQADIEVGARVQDSARNPERCVIDDEKNEIMYEILRGISARDREILTRFYLYEQNAEQICSEMRLSETQFRLLKSRAKARFGELGRKRLARTPFIDVLLRKATGAGH
ncbi:MAG TPA: sigma-70 family RNA polymerase sigma factor [Bryobacteraceae bacterium]|nr:sigma-70 family RNA polymerase sigma factor [Bryobacteraceae bacterium]HPT26562.1 sigma-70 family RNA polymerase sigma factor [Bryobacteraceae bacterium]